MNDETAWGMEERFWLGSVEDNEGVLSPECVMAFAEPVGILSGGAIVESLRSAPRWASVDMTERVIGRPDQATLVLAYRAEGSREGADPYRAYCTSTYRRIGAEWLLVQHQQTPLR